jgi:hypothetical protein
MMTGRMIHRFRSDLSRCLVLFVGALPLVGRAWAEPASIRFDGRDVELSVTEVGERTVRITEIASR